MEFFEGAKKGLILCLLAATLTLVCRLVITVNTINTTLLPSLQQGLTSLNQSAADLRKITGATQEYVALQLTMLRSSREQKAIQAGLEVAAAAKGTILLVNTQVVPRVMKNLDSLDQATQSLNKLVENTDLQVNSGLIPQATASIKQVESTLQAVQDQTTVIGADIHSLTSDQDLKMALSSLTDASHELDLSILHVEEALQQAPTIAKHIETITGASSKISKISSFGSIGLIAAKIYSLIF